MGNNKVSEKAVWEGSISPDNNTPSIASQMQTQPQMMFCYKCNNVIPSNSTFCPYCQIKLFAKCPKCGIKYSSQYPACHKCGTNREEYIETQKRKKEIIEAEKERLRQEKLEQEARERAQKEAYLKENAEIRETEEYKNTYCLLSHAVEDYQKKDKYSSFGLLLLFIPVLPMGIVIMVGKLCDPQLMVPPSFLSIFLIALVICLFMNFIVGTWSDKDEYLKKYILKKNNYDKEMATRAINTVGNKEQYGLSDCCIIAYREKHNLPINYEWHNNDNVK